MAAGKVAGVNPEAWKIIDGKLYLGWSKSGIDRLGRSSMGNSIWAGASPV
jgi:hypothetical protein